MALDLSFPLENSELVSICVESVLYGIYVVLFFSCVQVVFRRRIGRKVNRLLAATTLSLFVFITWHVIIDAVRLYNAFKTTNGLANSGADYYSKVDAPLSVMKTSLYVVITLISDAFILYRSFVVWQRSYLVVFVPICIFLADIATGLAASEGLSKVTPEQTFFIKRQDDLTKSFFSVTLVLNFTCSTLIAVRIYLNQRAFRQIMCTTISLPPSSPSTSTIPISPTVASASSPLPSSDTTESTSTKAATAKLSSAVSAATAAVSGGKDDLSRVAVIVIESGAIYSTLMCILVGTYDAEVTGVFSLFLDTMSPVIGIVFSSIIVRVARGISHGDGSSSFEASAPVLPQHHQRHRHHRRRPPRSDFIPATRSGFTDYTMGDMDHSGYSTGAVESDISSGVLSLAMGYEYDSEATVTADARPMTVDSMGDKSSYELHDLGAHVVKGKTSISSMEKDGEREMGALSDSSASVSSLSRHDAP